MNILSEAKRVLENEANAILKISNELNGEFEEAVDILYNCKGKVILSGMGKSGHIATKIASTLSSTGTPALFVHPAESSHGDLGMIDENDVCVIISNGGNTKELSDMLAYVSRIGVPLVGMTGNLDSQLADASNVVISIAVDEEACPMKLAPTTSTTVTLALGDALAMSLLKKKGFREENYAIFHPGGSLGRRLLTKVVDVMHTGDSLPLVKPSTSMKEVIAKMTAKEVRGVAGVVDDNGSLIGVITDGDIRRHLEHSDDPMSEPARDFMSRSPKTIHSNEMAQKALFMMEQFQIQTLFVVDGDSQRQSPVGLLHLQDLLKAKIR